MTDVDDTQLTPGAGELLQRMIAANAQDEIFLTDRGNGRRFAEIYRDSVRYVVDEDVWIVRQGSHWARDDRGLMTFALTGGVLREIRAQAMEIEDEQARDNVLGYATRAESEKTRRAMISCAREHPEIIITSEELDAESELLATSDGVIDLRTGEWRPVRDDEVHTRHVTVTYDPEATSPHLDRYLDTFVPDPEDQRVLFAVLGSACRGGNPARLMPVLIGGTTSGKSQLLGALKNLLGDYACAINVSVFRGNLDDRPRPDLVRAMHRRVAYAVEASKVWDLHADQVKRLTGGDPVTYRNLYERAVEAVPRFTPLIVTNEMPRVRGADAAFRRRILVFTFSRSLPPELEDTRVKEMFIRDEGCLRALLRRVVEGARDPLLRDGVRWSEMPERYLTAAFEAGDSLSHVVEFLAWMHDRGAIVPDASAPVSACVRTSELHEWYGRWIEKHGDKQDRAEKLNEADFRKALEDRGWEKKRSNGTRWVGVRLTQTPSVWGI